MKIAVNTRLLRKNQMDGLGWFAFSTLQHMVRKNPAVEFHFLFDTPPHPDFLFAPNIIPHVLFPPAKHALLNIVWFEWSVKNQLNKIRPDLFFSPDGLLCLGWEGRQHGMIADINFYHHPDDLKWTNQKYYNYYYPRYAKAATRLATISGYSKQDIVQSFQIAPGKIDIVYCGINSFFTPLEPEQQEQVRAQVAGGSDYFLFIGTLHPRKNIVRLLQAFELFKLQTGAPIKLVIAGRPSYKTEDIHRQHAQMKSKDDVIFPGRVQDDQINNVLGAALGLVYVPHFEGFGLPIIEAMQCDVPVISSNSTSMPEVAGDAALLVSPFSVEEIRDAMVNLYSDPALRSRLISKGRQQKQQFSWEKTAGLLWSSIQQCF